MTEIKRPGRRTLYEVEGATGGDVWEVPPFDPNEVADLIAEAQAFAGDVTSHQKCTHACGCDEPAVRARLDAIEDMAQAGGLTMTECQRVWLNQWLTPTGRQCWKCRRWHYGEGMRCDTCWPKQLPRPMAAAERTSSPRRRAGSRRTKRQARRQG